MQSILIVEDDEIMLKVVNSMLQREGYNVTVAKNGKEAFEKIRQHPYDLLITDLMMPYANGFEIISRVRAEAVHKEMGIIVISNIGNEDSITEGFKLGADDYLKKPIMTGELLIRIRRLLQERANPNAND
jgi:two-component system response regulator VicR